MAGIGRFSTGQKATAGRRFWTLEDRQLHFVVELDDTDVHDYGSDIGIDPQIEPGDSLTYTELDAYTGLWARTGIAQEQAIRRVIRNRRFADELRSEKDSMMGWLEELATQTRIPVMVEGRELAPRPVSTLQRFSPEIREWLLDNPSQLLELGDNGFEKLVGDFLQDMGYSVQMVSPTRRKDGGVDIAAWPRSGMRYLIAVQVKHHHTATKTGASDVRDFAGTLVRNPVFSFGLLVTNTTFTDDAKHFQQPLASNLRLRDESDVKRWLRGDFVGSAEWSDIPKEVSLGLSISFPVQAKELRPDDAFWKYQTKSAVALLRDALRRKPQSGSSDA